MKTFDLFVHFRYRNRNSEMNLFHVQCELKNYATTDTISCYQLLWVSGYYDDKQRVAVKGT